MDEVGDDSDDADEKAYEPVDLDVNTKNRKCGYKIDLKDRIRKWSI